MSLNEAKYDDFGELIWKQPPKPKKKPKKFNYQTMFKLLGEALI